MAVVADGMTICEEKLKRLSAEKYVLHSDKSLFQTDINDTTVSIRKDCSHA